MADRRDNDGWKLLGGMLEHRFDRLESMLRLVLQKENQIMADIKGLLDKLEAQTTVSAGYRVAVDEKLAALKAQIDILVAGQIDAPTQARLDAAFTAASADTDADAEATAILKGTPNA